MRKLFQYFAGKHLPAMCFTAALLGAGLIGLANVKRDLFPRVELNHVSITTMYPGASAEDVEQNLTDRIEKALGTVSEIKEVHSASYEGVSLVSVVLEEGLGSAGAEKTVREIRDALSRIRKMPGAVVEQPLVERSRGDQFPVLNLGVSGEVAYGELREVARRLEKKLKKARGVAEIRAVDLRTREVLVEASPGKLKQYRISLAEVADAVERRNIQATSGTLESYTGRKNIVTLAHFREVRDVGQVIVRTAFERPALRLKDLGSVRDGYSERRSVPRINGKRTIMLTVYKKEKADIISTVEAVKAVAAGSELPAGTEILYSGDLSRYVRSSFRTVWVNGIVGFVLVALTLTLFMSFRVSFWVALGIPVALLGTVALLPLFNVSLDVVTMTAMILVLGIIVDDGIIISERIYRRLEAGQTPLEAAGGGLSDVFLPVLTTVISTMLAFLPMLFYPGTTGKFIFVIPLVVILALSLSLLECVVALPAHLAASVGTRREPGRIQKFMGRLMTGLEQVYERALVWALKRRLLVLGGFSLVALLGVWVAGRLPMQLFPSDGAEEFMIYLETPPGSSLEVTAGAMGRVEELLRKRPAGEIASWTAVAGADEDQGRADSSAYIRVDLTPHSNRSKSAVEIVEELRGPAQSLPGFSRILFDVADSGPDPLRPVSLRIVGVNDEVRTRLADRIEHFLKQKSFLKDVERDDQRGREQLELRLNYLKLKQLGLNPADVSLNLRLFYEGYQAASFQNAGETVGVKLRLPESFRDSPRKLLSLNVPNQLGGMVPLRSFAVLKPRSGAAAYRRFDGERSVRIQAGLGAGAPEVLEIQRQIEEHVNLKDFPGVTLTFNGEAQQNSREMTRLSYLFLGALAGIFLLLAMLFNSFRLPWLVLAAVLFGGLGVIFIFALHGLPLSLIGMLGAVGLTGVVVNDSVILIDHLKESFGQKRFVSPDRLLAAAAKERLRPILVTTITTAAGVLPMGYGIGGSDPSNGPMALALGWGLVIATPLTLFVLPCLYRLALGRGRKPVRREAGDLKASFRPVVPELEVDS